MQVSQLTPRQLEIIGVIAQGYTEKQAAILLSISPATIHKHMSKAYERTGLDSRIRLIVAFAKWQERQEIISLLDPSRADNLQT